jgi:hypothetical protein
MLGSLGPMHFDGGHAVTTHVRNAPDTGEAPTVQLPVQPPAPLAEGPTAAAPTPSRANWPGRRVWIAGAAAAVLAAAGATAVYAYAGEVPRGTTVLGVDLGGMSRAEAASTLRGRLAGRAALAAPVSVVVGDKTVEITPADVGLAVDVYVRSTAAVRRSRPAPPQY